ncbi:MAG: hypothetical protein ACYCW6_08995 [Candidatus Xenobia bacterium]
MDGVNKAQWGSRALEIGASYNDHKKEEAGNVGGLHGSGNNQSNALEGIQKMQHDHVSGQPGGELPQAVREHQDNYKGVFGK